MPLPQFARVIVVESVAGPAARQRRRIDVRLRSPLLGEWFRYAGEFDDAEGNVQVPDATSTISEQ